VLTVKQENGAVTGTTGKITDAVVDSISIGKVSGLQGALDAKQTVGNMILDANASADATQNDDKAETGNNKTDNEGTAVTAENWDTYLEFVVETKVDEGFLNYHLYLKAKEGVIITNEINTKVYFSHNMNQHHYTKENNQVVLGTVDASDDTYASTFVMYGYENKVGYCEQIENINGSSWSFTEGERWTMIPDNFVITQIEGTIVAK
jgi:hypothetical protein